jgi:hypothetical protein
VGEEYLLSFRMNSSGLKALFDTRYGEGSCTDMAYLIRAGNPADVAQWTEGEAARQLTNVWFDKSSEEVTLKDLESWARAH